MLNADAVQAIIYRALTNLNAERGPQEQVALSPTTRLFGTDAVLDSLALVSVIVDVEEGVAAEAGRDVSLADDRAIGQAVAPYSTVETLTAYILQLLSEG